jgi:hypothetical protein
MINGKTFFALSQNLPTGMIQCSSCKNGFPRLEEGTTCGKCLARKPGKSVTELEAINVREKNLRLV